MTPKNLAEVLAAAGNPVHMLRNSRIGAYVYPVVPSEFSNWRDEQRAWRSTAVLFDQSHHMAELTVRGPDALRLMSYCTINSFTNFQPGKAKQMVPLSHDGYVIGDGILFYTAAEELLFVGRAPSVNWIQFHAETGGFKVDVIRDDRSPSHPRGKAVHRRHYRFQVQGPHAAQVLTRLNGGPLPEIRFFNFDTITIRGRKVTCEWNGEDLARIYGSLFIPGQDCCKFFDLPIANYASSSYDRIMAGGRTVGYSMFGGYSFNERCGLSLGVVDADIRMGDILTLVWGEEDGGTAKSTVERHRQTEVRVKVSPVPYSRDARESYQQGWRSRPA